MNILFLLKSFEIGGLEVVTSVLANKFAAEGHHVVLWAFYEGKTTLADRLDSRVGLVYGHGFNSGRANVAALRKTLQDNHIGIVINQWGLPYIPARTLSKAAAGLGVKTIAVYHNDPLSNGRTKEVEAALEHCDGPLRRALLGLKLAAFRRVTAASMRYIYRNSDRFMVLSGSFVRHFEDYTGIRNADKLIVQTNPVTVDTAGPGFESLRNHTRKQKEVVYVGRLDYSQKRVVRVVETWSLLEHRHPDWRLTIVGDGPERGNLERLVDTLNLRHVSFEGFKAPRPYYERASVLMLTSEFEGFPLVLAECMSFGVVPVVYGSYSAVYDIVRDGENGVVVKPGGDGFRAEAMAEALDGVMADPDRLHRMAEQALETSRGYSVDTIYAQWESLFRELCGIL